MMPGEWDSAEVTRWMRKVREAERRTIDRLVRVILCCDHCARPLKLTGYSPSGGTAVVLAVCPACDRYDERNDA